MSSKKEDELKYEEESTNEDFSLEDLSNSIEVQIQASEINLKSSFGCIYLLLGGIFITGIVALVHFW